MDELDESRLGTKAHWDDVYKREVKTFVDIGDEGEIWFGEEAAESMVDWVCENVPHSEGVDLRILDVGCGNGHLLFRLAEEGYPTSCLTGIDYSEDSIELSTSIAKSKDVSGIHWQVVDFLSEDSRLPGPYELILDKGTYDAICLSTADSTASETPAMRYVKSVASLLSPGSFFLITSCNWTVAELRKRFDVPDLSYETHIAKPTFTFGGHQGSTTATVVFRKTDAK